MSGVKHVTLTHWFTGSLIANKMIKFHITIYVNVHNNLQDLLQYLEKENYAIKEIVK